MTACIKYNVETITVVNKDQIVSANTLDRSLLGTMVVSDQRPGFGWVLLADPEGNEFDLEISVGELDTD